MKRLIESNDSFGLAGRYFRVPKEVPRPKSAVEYDRKGGLSGLVNAAQQREHWQRQAKNYKSMGQSRKNGKR